MVKVEIRIWKLIKKGQANELELVVRAEKMKLFSIDRQLYTDIMVALCLLAQFALT